MSPLKHKRALALAAALLSAAALARAEILLDETYEIFSPGSPPVTASTLVPRKATDTLSVTVVEGALNTASRGAGKGVRILDNAPKGATFEYNIVENAAAQKSVLRISFDIAWQPVAGAKESDSMNFGAGKYGDDKNTLVANANRLFTVSFYANGTVRVVCGSNAKSKTQRLGDAGKTSRFDIYLNDAATPLKTTAPDGKPLAVAPDTLVAFQNGKQFHSSKVEKFAGAEKQIGRVGFSTTSGAAGLDFVIDNLRVETIGE